MADSTSDSQQDKALVKDWVPLKELSEHYSSITSQTTRTNSDGLHVAIGKFGCKITLELLKLLSATGKEGLMPNEPQQARPIDHLIHDVIEGWLIRYDAQHNIVVSYEAIELMLRDNFIVPKEQSAHKSWASKIDWGSKHGHGQGHE